MLLIMKNNFTTQEILLMTNTRFSAREYSIKEEENGPQRSAKDKLAEACWNGLITEMLPEICITKNKKSLTLWELGEAQHLFYLHLGEVDTVPDAAFTLNPYRFTERSVMN